MVAQPLLTDGAVATCTSAGSIFEAISSCKKLAQPCITPGHFDIVNEDIPCLDQRGTITAVIAIVPSMLKECINVELMFSAKATGTEDKLVKLL